MHNLHLKQHAEPLINCFLSFGSSFAQFRTKLSQLRNVYILKFRRWPQIPRKAWIKTWLRPFEINVHVAHLHKKPGHLVTSYSKIFQNNFNQTH